MAGKHSKPDKPDLPKRNETPHDQIPTDFGPYPVVFDGNVECFKCGVKCTCSKKK